MNQLIIEHQPKLDQSIDHLKRELIELHVGRAQPSLIENVTIDAYGAKTALKQLGNIAVADSKTLVVQIWDKSIIKNVEKSLVESPIEMGVNLDGDLIRVILPSLTEDRRKQLIKVMHQRLEQARIKIRAVRDEIREIITEKFRNKEISEDEKYRLYEDLDKLTSDYTNKIKEIGENKEEDITTI